MAQVEKMVEQVEVLLADVKDNLTDLSRVCDRLMALKFSPVVENTKQVPAAVLCEPKRSYDANAAFYNYSASQNTKSGKSEEDFTSNYPTSLQFNSMEILKTEKKLPVSSVIFQPKPDHLAPSTSSVVETDKDEDVPTASRNCSSVREIMMMVEGKEINIISVRPKLIKKKN